MNNPSLDLVVPIYNEGEKIVELLKKFKITSKLILEYYYVTMKIMTMFFNIFNIFKILISQ